MPKRSAARSGSVSAWVRPTRETSVKHENRHTESEAKAMPAIRSLRTLIASGRSPHARGGEPLQRGQCLARVGADGVVRAHLGVADLAVAVDDVAGRHREGPAFVDVEGRQAHAEPLVEVDQVVGQAEAEAIA